MLLLTAKNLAIVFGLAATAFCVSTIVLAVEKSNLEQELQDALNKLDTISTIAASSTTPMPQSSSTSSSMPSTEQVPITSEETKSTSSSTPSTTTVPSEPNFPTLPTGLPNPEEITYRLPNEIRPVKYKLYIYPDLKSKTCEGSVSIQIEIAKTTNLIVLHAKNLEINTITILNMMARMRIRVRKSYLDVKREMLFIELDEVLFTSTPYVVSINYNCNLTGLEGMYLSSYLDADKEHR